MNDQTAKKDNGKIEITLATPEIMEAVAVVKMFGNEKYPEGGNDNWKKVEIERYRNALFRHLFEYLREPYKLDTESNLPSLYHAAWNISTLLWLEMQAGTIPRPEEALKKMHHPAPVGAPRSPEVGEGRIYYSKAIKKVDEGEITIGEYEQMINVLRDVEPVVRCRDCLYWQKSSLFSGHMVCRYVVDCSVVRREDDFCSRGERKDGGNG